LKKLLIILAIVAQGFGISLAQSLGKTIRFDYLGDTISTDCDATLDAPLDDSLNPKQLRDFHRKLAAANYQPLLATLLQYRAAKGLDDWFYYQLVRKAAEQLAPKAVNYHRYTLFKWFLLVKSGYDARINLFDQQLLLYVQSNDDVFDIPYYVSEGKTYVCLNVHDYAKARQQLGNSLVSVALHEPLATAAFSYRIQQAPALKGNYYQTTTLQFPYRNQIQRVAVQLNHNIKQLFANYPVVDFEAYFNIPLSAETYNSLMPVLKKNLSTLSVSAGVEYLLQFTRHAFPYADDQSNFGKEKRMGAEETLMSASSDCDDRAALFFYLVKEIYNLPMIAILLPTHITIGVQFAEPIGETVEYEGRRFSICEPTLPSRLPTAMPVPTAWKNAGYEVVYAYRPH
jgi:hypothetical protein